MKRTLPATVTVSLLLIVGSAASQDAAPSKDAETAKEAEAPKEAAAPAETAAPKEVAKVETEPPELKRLAGSYTLVGNQADSIVAINAAIKSAIMGMGGLKKDVARKRLNAVNKVVTRLKISSVRKDVTVGMDDYVVTAPLDGGSVEVKTPSGDTARASFKLATATLVQDMVQSKGRRENAFRFNSHGNLVMNVRETSSQLTAPVSYTLVFKRAGK